MEKNEKLNKHGYPDLTAYDAVRKAEGAEAKAYYCMKTILSVARLAGMEIVGDVRLKDRTGKIHDGLLVVWRRDNVVDGTAEKERAERHTDNFQY